MYSSGAIIELEDFWADVLHTTVAQQHSTRRRQGGDIVMYAYYG